MEASDSPALNQQPHGQEEDPNLGERNQDMDPNLGERDRWTGCLRVRVEDSWFTVERSLLVGCSDYFRALFSSGMTDSCQEQLHLRGGVRARGFLTALTVCRGQEVSPALTDPEQLVEAVECAAFLQVAPLSRYLCDLVDSDNVLLLLHAASVYGVTSLLHSSALFLRDAYDDLREEAETSLPEELLRYVESLSFNPPLRYVESLSPAAYIALGTHSPAVEGLSDPYRVVCYLDETQGEWRHLVDIPNPCSTALAGVAVLDNRLYVVGGVYGYGKATVDAGFCYDPETGVWSAIPGPQQPRCDFTLLGHEGRLYAIGGEVDRKTVSSAEAYDVRTGRWAPVSPTPRPVAAVACAVARRRMFLCFWRPPDTTDIYEYQAGPDRWTLVTTMRRPQSYGHCMVAHRDNLYVMRNGPGDDFLRCLMERYNLTTGQWSALPGLYVNSKGALFSAVVRADRVFTVKHMLTLVYSVEAGGRAWTPRRQMKGFPKSGSLWTCMLRLPRTAPLTPEDNPVLKPPPLPDRSEGLVDLRPQWP